MISSALQVVNQLRKSTPGLKNTTLRATRLTGQTSGKIYVADYQGREHVVVPVIAIVAPAVVHPITSEDPELVTLEAISLTPGAWNNRPLVPDHPGDDWEGSANHPEFLEGNGFGQIFNASIEDDTDSGGLCRLHLEAWIDRARTEELGGQSLSVLARCLEGSPVEVSIGAYILVESRAGVYNGKGYKAIWRFVVPDHLAMLPEDAIGACSWETGCGAPRLMRGEREVPKPVAKRGKLAPAAPPAQSTGLQLAVQALRSTLAQFVTGKAPGVEVTPVSIPGSFANPTSLLDVGQRSIYDQLWGLLYALEPGMYSIDDTIPDALQVIYITCPDGDYYYYRRTYSVDDSGEVTLNDDRVEVRPIRVYVEVSGQEDPEVTAVSASEDHESEVATYIQAITAALSAESPNPANAHRTHTIVQPSQLSARASGQPTHACSCNGGSTTMALTAPQRQQIIAQFPATEHAGLASLSDATLQQLGQSRQVAAPAAPAAPAPAPVAPAAPAALATAAQPAAPPFAPALYGTYYVQVTTADGQTTFVPVTALPMPVAPALTGLATAPLYQAAPAPAQPTAPSTAAPQVVLPPAMLQTLLSLAGEQTAREQAERAQLIGYLTTASSIPAATLGSYDTARLRELGSLAGYNAGLDPLGSPSFAGLGMPGDPASLNAETEPPELDIYAHLSPSTQKVS